MAKAPTCPQCGAPLPGESWAGLCPRCLVRVSLEAPAKQVRACVQHRAEGSSLTAEQRASTDGPENTAPISQPDTALEQTGMVIGRYKLLQQIGEGASN
jgi:uncharacterized Zn finger protein (UPF0148 family)